MRFRRRRRTGAPHAVRTRTLLLIAAVCMAPIVASYTIYYFFPREPTANYGTLLPAGPAPAIAGVTPDGAPFALADLHGRWVPS